MSTYDRITNADAASPEWSTSPLQRLFLISESAADLYYLWLVLCIYTLHAAPLSQLLLLLLTAISAVTATRSHVHVVGGTEKF